MQNALNPVDYEVVQSVFNSLAAAEWFDRSEANEQDCAKLVLLIHSSGIDDAERLHQGKKRNSSISFGGAHNSSRGMRRPPAAPSGLRATRTRALF